MNIKHFLKNFGGKTAALIGVLLLLFILQLFFYSQRLLPLWLFAIYGVGCLVFIGLNIYDRKNQLKKKGEEMVQKADDLFRKGEIKGAMRDYNKALEMKGPTWGAYLGLGHCYKALSDYKKALEYAQKALECKDDSAAALYLIGLCLFRQDYPDSALKHLEKALKINPSLTDCYMIMGEVHSSLGRKEEAMKNYTLFLEGTTDEKTRKVVKERIDKLSS